MMKKAMLLSFTLAVTGCAALTGPRFNPGPEYNQKIYLLVNEEYRGFQAPRSTYDVGDLQSFHVQHTFPVLVEGAFNEIFGEVQAIRQEAGIETDVPDVPAIFEVHLIDLAHDIHMAADSYRSQAMIAAAMKTPEGEIMWQQAFRGDGYVAVDPQFSTGLGPQDAVVDAVGDALYQMQKAIVESPVIQRQLRFGRAYQEARRRGEVRF